MAGETRYFPAEIVCTGRITIGEIAPFLSKKNTKLLTLIIERCSKVIWSGFILLLLFQHQPSTVRTFN